MVTVYGIRNCSTVKRALAWLDEQGIVYRFHDYKKSGVTLDCLQRWSTQLGWSALLNTRGTTWRRLTPAERELPDAAAALALMQAQTSLIRRPVIEWSEALVVGFDAAAQTKLSEQRIRKGQA